MGMALRGHRYKLSPTGEQRRQLARWAGCCRYVFNTALAHRQATYVSTGKGISYAALCKQLTAWKKVLPWLKKPPAMLLQQAIRDLDDAFTNFFAKRARYPRFRSRHHWQPSLRIPQDKTTLRVERLSRSVGRLNLPKLGWIRFRWSRIPEGSIRSATLSRDACGDWFVSLLCATEVQDVVETTEVDPEHFRGIDLGITRPVTTDDGLNHNIPTPTKGDRRHAAKLARAVSRKQKGSANRAKAQHRLNRFHRQWRNRRTDAHHKLSNTLIAENQGIAVEDLKIPNMTRRAKRKRVRQKSGLNRSILHQSWGSFLAMLAWKGRAAGVIVERVSARYTSQTCSVCGVIDVASRPTQASFVCTACGHADNADVNAAKNIRAAGLSSIKACGVHVRPCPLRRARQRTMKQVPTGNQRALPLGM